MSSPQRDFLGSGKRKKVVIDNENFYITITPTSVTATVPFENRKEKETLRQIIDSLMDQITETLEELEDERNRKAGANSGEEL